MRTYSILFLILVLISCKKGAKKLEINKTEQDCDYIEYEEEITGLFHYMAYACGECYPQYKLSQILNTTIEEEKRRHLLETDMHIKFAFRSKEFEEEFELLGKHISLICFYYKFTGKLQYHKYKGFILNVTKVDITFRENCCDDCPKSIPKRITYP